MDCGSGKGRRENLRQILGGFAQGKFLQRCDQRDSQQARRLQPIQNPDEQNEQHMYHEIE